VQYLQSSGSHLRGDFALQGTCGHIWRHFWLSELWGLLLISVVIGQQCILQSTDSLSRKRDAKVSII
jgi:hypothetical protein